MFFDWIRFTQTNTPVSMVAPLGHTPCDVRFSNSLALNRFIWVARLLAKFCRSGALKCTWQTYRSLRINVGIRWIVCGAQPNTKTSQLQTSLGARNATQQMPANSRLYMAMCTHMRWLMIWNWLLTLSWWCACAQQLHRRYGIKIGITSSAKRV